MNFNLKSILIFALLIVIMPGLFGCGGSAAPEPANSSTSNTSPEAAADNEPAASTATGGTVRVGWPGSPDSLNPAMGVLEEAYIVYEMTYDTLYDLQFDGSFTLTLAESVDMSDDGKVYTYKMREGLKFHDGQPLTAKDVVFSYNLYKDHEDFPFLNSYTGYFDTIEAPDDSTVVLTLTDPIPNLESQLIYLYVLPEHIWSAHSEGSAPTEFENTEMIGSGPFKMVEYKQNEFVHLAANLDYFDGRPKVDEVIFQTFANNDALVQAITTGQVDMITEMPATAVPTLRNAENVTLVSGPPLAPDLRDIFFNQIAPENCPPDDGVCSGHPALRDRQVRLALAHATDKQKMIDVAMLGFGRPGRTLVPDGLGSWYNSSLEDYAFDLAKANQILDEAGYQDTDGDGVREMPDGGQPLEFRLYWPSDTPEAPRLADLLNETWPQVGVKLQPQAFDPDALTSVCCPAFDFDVIIWGWSSGPDPSDLMVVMTTAEIPTGSSETGYSNPEYDRLFAEQAVELDKDKRRELNWELQRIAFEDVVYIVPYYKEKVQAFRSDRFEGWLTDAAKLELADPTSLSVITQVNE